MSLGPAGSFGSHVLISPTPIVRTLKQRRSGIQEAEAYRSSTRVAGKRLKCNSTTSHLLIHGVKRPSAAEWMGAGSNMWGTQGGIDCSPGRISEKHGQQAWALVVSDEPDQAQ